MTLRRSARAGNTTGRYGPPMPRPAALSHVRATPLGRRAERAARAALAAARASEEPVADPPPVPRPHEHDSLLEHLLGGPLAELDAACAAATAAGPEAERAAYARFAGLDLDLWAILLTQQQTAFPHIRALLPAVPAPDLQVMWNGLSGAPLASQSAAFYAKVLDRHTTYGLRPLDEARVLDHGVGWGRLVRFFARDVGPGRLFGTDPVQSILDVCRRDRVPAELHRTEFLPDELPVGDLDLAYAFSVFTHLSEGAAARSLDALHGALRPGGLLVVTIRPPDFLWLDPLLHPQLAQLGPDWRAALQRPRHLFVPHPADPGHFQYEGGEMTYGEAVITLPYVRERWAPRFELLDVAPLIGDLHQVVLTLRRP